MNNFVFVTTLPVCRVVTLFLVYVCERTIVNTAVVEEKSVVVVFGMCVVVVGDVR